MFKSLVSKMTRKKTFQADSVSESSLARVLTIFDLIGLGVGSTLGLGVYVMAGSVSKEEAGPGVAISFIIAAVASLFAGLCYAEFGARVPRAGSAYVYSYVTIGEFIAFLIGWNLILEYVIGTASVVRGLTGYIDSLANNVIGNAFRSAMPIDVSFLSSYPDFLAFGLTITLSVALAFGVKESSIANNIMTMVNVSVIIFSIFAGSVKADFGNWQIAKEDIPPGIDGGEGGFIPFGISGLIKGAATCFYGFVGFDCIATTGEEAINPQRNIPLAIVISLLIVFLCYFGVSSVLTLMLPYFYQDTAAPLSYAFQQVGWEWARWIVSIGAIFGLTASFFGALFPLPRIIYAMSSDGLLFKFMGKIHPRFKTPMIGTILSGGFTAIMALVFDVDQLVNMMSIGTLLAYSMVAACVLLLRYTEDTEDNLEHSLTVDDEFVLSEKKTKNSNGYTIKNVMRQFFNIDRLKHPTKLSTTIVAYEIIFFFVLSILVSELIIQAGSAISEVDPLALSGLVILVLCICCSLISIALQPTSDKKLNFKVPFVPVLPAVSIFVNMYLMMMLDAYTWIRFAIWIVVGLIIYFFYGVKNSKAVYKKVSKYNNFPSAEHGIDNIAHLDKDDIAPM